MPRRIAGSGTSSTGRRTARSARSHTSGDQQTTSSSTQQSTNSSTASDTQSSRQRVSDRVHNWRRNRHRTSSEQYTGWHMIMNPLWCYHGFRIIVAALTVFGLIMVFSSSAVTMVATGASPWAQLISQGIYCVLGVIAALILMHVPYNLYRRIALPAMVVAIVLQFATLTPLGIEVQGNRGWIGIPGVFQIQPAEIMKLVLCFWLPRAVLEAQKHAKKLGWKAYLHVIGWYGLGLLAVVLGKDLGTALIIIAIGVTGLLLGGFPLRQFAMAAGVLLVGVIGLIIISPNRMSRIIATYTECSPTDLQGVCYQAMHAKYAMASGGLLGVGIGNSREKWNYLPEAHNDFIYAIIGEETGFIGALAVLLLFLMLGWCLVIVALRTRNRYVSISLVCFTVWIVGQALINMGVVVGMLPVMGVPLPFVSAGGSSLVMCLGAAGIADSMMRAQPEIRAEKAA